MVDSDTDMTAHDSAYRYDFVRTEEIKGVAARGLPKRHAAYPSMPYRVLSALFPPSPYPLSSLFYVPPRLRFRFLRFYTLL